jgi:hypothetical protein
MANPQNPYPCCNQRGILANGIKLVTTLGKWFEYPIEEVRRCIEKMGS